MKITLLAGALALAALPAVAKDKLIPLMPADAAALKDKTVALTLHETADFGAMTAGKAGFGVFGVLAMFKAGNDMVRENQIADPALLVREHLAAGLQNAYGARLLAPDAAATKAKKPKQIAALHPEADYVLDVDSVGWGYLYFPTDWNNYHVGYSVKVQLVAKDGRAVSSAVCSADSKAEKEPPKREQLLADGARMVKDYTTALGWNCVQLLGAEQFKLPADKLAPTPEPYAAMLTRFTPAGVNAPANAPANAPVAAEASAPTAEASVEAAKAPAKDGPAAAAAAAAPAADPAKSDGEG